jgi:O-methyltransferase
MKKSEAAIKEYWDKIFRADPTKRQSDPSVRTYVAFGRFHHAYESAYEYAQQSSGAIVECGTWRGGVFAVMAMAVQDAGGDNALWGFDTFTGLPDPTAPDLRGRKAHGRGASKNPNDLLATIDEVNDTLYNVFELQTDLKVKLVKGLFGNTLPKVRDEIGGICLLRLDGDLYQSTKNCLDILYSQVTPRGKIIIDDYNSWCGCRQAVDEFRKQHNIRSPLQNASTEKFWIKDE